MCIRQRVTHVPVSPLWEQLSMLSPPTGHCPSHYHDLKILKVKSLFGLWPSPLSTLEATTLCWVETPS